MIHGFYKGIRAITAIAPFLIVKAVAGGVAVASAATDPLIGTSDSLGCAVDKMLDVAMGNQPDVTAGGAITFGDELTSDAQGRAIKAVPVTGVITRTIGFAMSDANLGDIFPYHYAPGTIAKSA